MSTTLLSRNVTVDGHRTSMRLEPVMWEALAEICRRERRSVHEICTMVDTRRMTSSLTAALRVYILEYFRTAATEEGHVLAGHGAVPARAAAPVPLAPRATHEHNAGQGEAEQPETHALGRV